MAGSGVPRRPPAAALAAFLAGGSALLAAAAAAAQPASAVPSEPRWTEPVLHAAATFTVLRTAEALFWPAPFAEFSAEALGARLGAAYGRPPLFDASRPAFRWDGDPLIINLGGHALLGSELYARARLCRFSPALALVFTAAASAVWEYGYEATGVRPSAQDLIYTPLAGAALGEVRFRLFQAASRLRAPGPRKVARALLDPLGELERDAFRLRC